MKLVMTLVLVVPVAAGLTAPAQAAPRAAPAPGQVMVVQAVPGAEVDVAVDGTTVRRGAAAGSLVGPLALSGGKHDLVFTGVPGGHPVRTRLEVASGSSSDVVLHLPASVDGAAVVNTYRTPTKPIGPGKARVLVAHTATVAPADVTFDGQVVFQDIANGEYAEADVPAGRHRVALLATGTTGTPILGPLAVGLAPRTATMAYAYGRPQNGSMSVIVHTLGLASDGTVVPRRVETGSTGLVTVPVSTFTTPPARPGLDWAGLVALLGRPPR